jgi:tetratricopeptide (TPR) repeat protein
VGANKTTRAMIRQMLAGDGDHELNLERSIALDDGTDNDARGALDLPPYRLRPYLILCDERRKRGDPAGGAKVLAAVVERWPDDADLHLGLARCYDELGDWTAAEASYRRSVELAPRAETCIFLAATLDHLGRFDEARSWLQRALVIDPDYEEAHYNIGSGHAKRNELDDAIRHLRRAIEIDPLYTVAHALLGKVLLHRAQQAADPQGHPDWGAARAHLEDAVELHSADPDVHRLLAEMSRAAE